MLQQKAMFPKQQPSCLIFFLLIMYSFPFSYQRVCDHQDQSSLLAFSEDISSSPPLNWSSSTSCCQWEGVECDIKGKVTHLQLPYRGLKGEITSSITNLISLTHLNLSNNYLHGPLGEGIARLTNLTIIDLSSNTILGSIPREIGNLLRLEKFHLESNNLSGPIPSSLTNCTNLVEIILRDNYLDGDFSKLDFSKLVLLQKLDLRNNSLSGTLPESIYACKSLVAIGLSINNLSGQISPKIVGLKSLSFIALNYNNFTNITTTLTFLGKCKNLTTLMLSSNFHGESLPIHRNFIGFNDFPNLQFFWLERCNFVPGPIPKWLLNLKRLRALYLRENRITGEVPDWLGTLPNLSKLELGYNSLSGEFPLKLCQLPALISQSVEQNFHFDLPMFAFLDSASVFIAQYNGPTFYKGLSLNGNTLSGDIPREIGNLRNLQLLELYENHFSGHIPDEISNLQHLVVLDLSTNNFSGEIPTSLGKLNFLSYFGVSDNNLEGPIPTGGQFDTFPESSFEGNLGLCGEPLNRPCASIATRGPKTIARSESHHSKQLFLNGLFVGLASGFSGVLVIVASYFWFNYIKRTRSCSRRG